MHGWLRLCIVGSALALVSLQPAQADLFAPAEYEFLDEDVVGEVDIRFQLSVGGGWTGRSVARVVFNYADEMNYLYLQMASTGALLAEVRNGEHEVLATHAGWPLPAGPGGYQMIVKRRAWAIRVLCDRSCILSTYEEFAPGEKIGWAQREIQVEDLHAQPIGEMVFEDDFARPPGEPDPWQVLSGTWAVRLPESRNRSDDAARSANPFSYVATGPEALSVAGEPFWDGYEVRAAVRPGGTGTVGVVCYAQENGDGYYLGALTAGVRGEGDPGRVELVRRHGGVETVLAATAASIPVAKWLELGLRAHDGRLEGLVDGKVVCTASDNALGEGRIGLFIRNCSRAHFDDVRLRPYASFEDRFEPDGAIPVEQVAGQWRIADGRLYGRPDPRSGMAIGVTGCSFWRDYCFAADVTAQRGAGVGLFVGRKGLTDYILFRWGADLAQPSRQVQELWRVAEGKGEVIARREAPLDDRLHRIEVTADRAYISVRVDGKLALEGVDLAGGDRGQVGYYVEGDHRSEASFDNMRVTFCEPAPQPARIAEQFAKEDTMANWARPLSSWRALGGRVYTYLLPLWGDFDLRLNLRHLLGRDGSVSVRLAGGPDALAEAKDLVSLVGIKGDPSVICKSGGPEGSREGRRVPREGEEVLAEVERRGSLLVVSINGVPAAWARAEGGASAPTLGLKLTGVGTNLNDATVVSPNILDFTFSAAPTEWLPQSGLWEISDRWTCQPQWSWFCGRAAETPLIWTKQSFAGDMVLEYWAAMMMDRNGGGGYSHPSDLNAVLCGDGKDLCSGYAFVFAGDNNTCSKILRKGKLVAATTEVRFMNPSTAGDLNAFHRHWFHCRAEKIGNLLTFYVDGKKALEYRDPEPLEGGRVGLWTHQGNGMLVARTRIAFERPGP